MKTIHVEVTAEDIRRGVRGKANCCPVAIAIKRTTNHPYVAVNGIQIIVGKNQLHASFLRAPEEVFQFVEDFDDDDPVEPFAFDLQIPEGADA